MGTRVTGSTTLSTTTSSELLFCHKLTASQNYEERMLVCHFQSHKLSLRLHTFWALTWGRKSVTRGRDHCYVICQRQMWNSTAIESCNRISSAMIFVLCSTLCSVCRITQVSNMYCLQKLWYMSHTSLIIVDVTSCTMPAAMKTKFLRVGPELSPPSGNHLIK